VREATGKGQIFPFENIILPAISVAISRNLSGGDAPVNPAAARPYFAGT
jgi:hypothetical protein